jgi:DNA-directed RNA polymerase specialized sigma24 family protein
VRNACYTWLQQKRVREPVTTFDEEIHGVHAGAATPVTLLLRKEDKQTVRQAVEELPVDLRAVVVLRELDAVRDELLGHLEPERARVAGFRAPCSGEGTVIDP